MRTLRNRRVKHCGNTKLFSVIVRGFREVGEVVDRIVDEHRDYPRQWSCRTPWAHNLCLHLIWSGSRTSRCRCGVAHLLHFSGRESTARSCGCRSQQWGRSRNWSRSDRAGTARKTGESWEEMERSRTHTQTPFLQTLEPWAMRVVWHAWRCADVRRQTVQQKNVRATGECLYTSRRTHCSCYYMRTKPKKKNCREKSNERKNEHLSLHDHLDKKNSSIRRLGSESVCTEHPF